MRCISESSVINSDIEISAALGSCEVLIILTTQTPRRVMVVMNIVLVQVGQGLRKVPISTASHAYVSLGACFWSFAPVRKYFVKSSPSLVFPTESVPRLRTFIRIGCWVLHHSSSALVTSRASHWTLPCAISLIRDKQTEAGLVVLCQMYRVFCVVLH
jgi:hypothetical protein